MDQQALDDRARAALVLSSRRCRATTIHATTHLFARSFVYWRPWPQRKQTDVGNSATRHRHELIDTSEFANPSAALYEQIQTLISSAELVTEKACVAKKDIRAQLGSVEFMTQYTNERGADCDRTIGATDGLVRLFSHDFLPLVILRNKALAWIDKLPWVKRKFSMAAMGYAGRSTKLARGLTK